MKGALSIRDLAWAAVQRGEDIRYLAMRYSIPVEKLEHAKKEWERRKEKAAEQRAGMAARHASGLRRPEQSESETAMGVESFEGAGA
jgi:hypothetical protein